MYVKFCDLRFVLRNFLGKFLYNNYNEFIYCIFILEQTLFYKNDKIKTLSIILSFQLIQSLDQSYNIYHYVQFQRITGIT